MPRTLEKTLKNIAKKRNGKIEALHQNSRDSKRLHRAQVRDEKLDKIASARRKNEQPRLERAAFFHSVVKANDGQPFQLDQVHSKIKEFVHQYDEEYDSVKKARRPGRPPSTREDLLKRKIAELETEYQKGFFVPDLTDEENVKQLSRWEGSWSYLSTLTWVKVSAGGTVKPTTWAHDK